jgi:hypothetical protein
MLFLFGALNNLSNSSGVKNSTCLSSAFIKSIDVGDKLLCHFLSRNFKKLLIVIIYALAVFIDIFLLFSYK